MADVEVTRRLAAIVAADVAGYSRLVSAGEEGTLAALRRHRAQFIDPMITQHGGRIANTAGDSLLIEFPSVVEALRCAVKVQRGMNERDTEVPEDRRITFRIGINLGDVVEQEGDLLGDGVNIAARLEGMAPPGGIYISQQAFDHVATKLDLKYEDVGEQKFKNISTPVHVCSVQPVEPNDLDEIRRSDSLPLHQAVQFRTTSDGVQIAYATVGAGPPLVKAANFLSHLEYDWNSPVWRHVMTELAKDHLLVRYDQRGNGLSDWDVEHISFDAWVRDLEAVVDAVALERFALFGISQGCAASIRYTMLHPERVICLVLHGGYVRGRLHRDSTDQIEQSQALNTLVRQGWGQENPAFRQIFSSLFIPGASPKQMQWFNDLQRVSASPENAVRIREAFDEINVSDDLREISIPTLVLHSRNDAVVPFEEGRKMAGMIRGARFVALESQNHLILQDEPAWPRFVEEVRDFLRGVHHAESNY